VTIRGSCFVAPSWYLIKYPS